MQTLELKSMGLQEMSRLEVDQVEGGKSLPTWVKGTIWGWIAMEVIDNWQDVKDGIRDGWNSVKYN